MSEKKSVAVTRRVQGYPPPRIHSLAVGYSKVYNVGQSELVTEALKQFFDRMPEGERARILTASKNHY